MKGINILSAIVDYGKINLPVGYEVVRKNLLSEEEKLNKKRRKNELSKNELFRKVVQQAKHNEVAFQYVLADSWYASKKYGIYQ